MKYLRFIYIFLLFVMLSSCKKNNEIINTYIDVNAFDDIIPTQVVVEFEETEHGEAIIEFSYTGLEAVGKTRIEARGQKSYYSDTLDSYKVVGDGLILLKQTFKIINDDYSIEVIIRNSANRLIDIKSINN